MSIILSMGLLLLEKIWIVSSFFIKKLIFYEGRVGLLL